MRKNKINTTVESREIERLYARIYKVEHKMTRLLVFLKDELKAEGKTCEARIVEMIDNTY